MHIAIVEARRITKIYNQGKVESNALRGLNLEIRHSEMVSIMGPSGCGKTTLLNLLAGLDRPTYGEIFLDGKALTMMNDSELTWLRLQSIGIIFQFLGTGCPCNTYIGKLISVIFTSSEVDTMITLT